MAKVNPFRPGAPVSPGLFVGRLSELQAMEQALVQTRAGQPQNFMVTGERGIGKTSLLDYIRLAARGEIALENDNLRFLVASTDIVANTTTIGLIKRIERDIRRSLAKTEKAREFLSAAWSFVKRLEAAGVKLRDAKEDSDLEVLLDDFAYSLADTTNRITQEDSSGTFGARYDGVLLLIDEADKASRELELGAFLKLLLERVQRHGCERLMVGLAGLETLRDTLYASHESSLRLFDELRVERLSDREVEKVIDRCLDKAAETNDQRTEITPKGRKAMVTLSEGYPHFIQQIGYCAFERDDDDEISQEDVVLSAVGPRGAIERIGDRYYRDDFYKRIQKDSYRQVLRIMAEKLDQWVAKDEIREKFTGQESTLSNAIYALRDRHIIQSKEGTQGVYRLQNKAFALWIKLYTSEPKQLALGVEEDAV